MAERQWTMPALGVRCGHLTCIKYKEPWPGVRLWTCRCDCGRVIDVSENALICGVKTNCGCRSSKARDLSGQRFGRLVAMEPVKERGRDNSVRWLCRCDCGSYTVVSSGRLLAGHTESCGCKKEELFGTGRTFVNGTCLEYIKSDKLRTNNTSGYKGVSGRNGKWVAYIYFAGRYYHLGTYENISQAVSIRREAEDIRLRLATEVGSEREARAAFAEETGRLIASYSASL